MQKLIPYFILDLVILVMAGIGCAQKKPVSNLITLVLSAFGSLLALALTWEHSHPGTMPCSIHGNGCSSTLASTYGAVGPIPTSLFGFGMYALFVLLALKRKQSLAEDRAQEEARVRAYSAAESSEASGDRMATPVTTADVFRGTDRAESPGVAANPLKSHIARLDQLTWLLAVTGLGISWWLQYVAIWELRSFCPYCFTSAITVTALFILASRDYLFVGRTLTGEQKLLSGVVAFVVVMMGFIAVPDALNVINGVVTHQDGPPPPIQIAQLLRDVIIRPGLNSKGDPKAKYTLVEFADYFCPHCKEASAEIPGILANHPEIRLIYRNYPLGFPHVKFPHSDKASVAAEAAALQGENKFWEMHDFLFAHQEQMTNLSFTDDMFAEFAGAVGLDVERFKRDYNDPKLLARVIQDHDDGDQAGMEMTPTFFFVTPDQVTRFVGIKDLKKIIGDPKNAAWK